jgi:hypothetical protein
MGAANVEPSPLIVPPPPELELDELVLVAPGALLALELELLLDPHAAIPRDAVTVRATALRRLFLTSSPSIVVPRSVGRCGRRGVIEL